MGTNIFDPDDDTLPDCGHEVLGLPKAEPEPVKAVSNAFKLFWFFLLGAFLGLALGFSFALGTPVLVAEAMK